MNFDTLHPADQLVMLMDRIYSYGMTTTSGGNLSILDDNGDIWITPGGIDKGTLTRADIIQVKPDGTVIGIHKPSSEFPVHERIYRARPDIKGILADPVGSTMGGGEHADYNIEGIGNDLDFGPSNIGSPSLFVKSLAVAGE